MLGFFFAFDLRQQGDLLLLDAPGQARQRGPKNNRSKMKGNHWVCISLDHKALFHSGGLL